MDPETLAREMAASLVSLRFGEWENCLYVAGREIDGWTAARTGNAEDAAESWRLTMSAALAPLLAAALRPRLTGDHLSGERLAEIGRMRPGDGLIAFRDAAAELLGEVRLCREELRLMQTDSGQFDAGRRAGSEEVTASMLAAAVAVREAAAAAALSARPHDAPCSCGECLGALGAAAAVRGLSLP